MNQLSIFTLKALKKIYFRTFGGYKQPLLEREENPNIISDKIYNLLVSDEPCMIARFGSTELAAIVNYIGVINNKHSIIDYIIGKEPEWWWNKSILKQMKNWSGFYPSTPSNMLKFGKLMIEDAQQVDLLGSWLLNENYIYKYCQPNLQKVWLIFLDPFWVEKPWTRALEGKKILVIHPFAEIIEEQYKNKREKLFKNQSILPKFELKTIKAVQSLGGNNKEYSSWFSALDYMKSQVDNTDFDICLLGCGAYGFPLAAHIKRIGKKAIHLGGSLQLLFGIIGNRWDNPNYAKAARKVCPNLSYPSLFNPYWVRPTHLRDKSTKSVENNCYW